MLKLKFLFDYTDSPLWSNDDDVDLDTVWETATKDIPRLILEIESIIEEMK